MIIGNIEETLKNLGKIVGIEIPEDELIQAGYNPNEKKASENPQE